MKKSVKKPEPSTKKIVPFKEDAEIQKIQADSESVIETANELQITDTESNKKALDFKGDIMRFIKGIETKRLEYVAPLNEYIRFIININFLMTLIFIINISTYAVDKAY